MQKAISAPPDKYRVATVLSVINDKVTVETEDGVILQVWGTAIQGQEIMIKGDSILARIDKQDTLNAYVP